MRNRAALLLAYVAYAQRIERALLDLRFFRVPTYRASALGGSLFRIGLGAMPFLLPLMLQAGLAMSAFESGLITCASAVGGMFMRSLATTALRRFGFRRVLLYNAALSSIASAACGTFFRGMPTWLIWAIVLLGGFFPALQFTSLNSLLYAHTPNRDIGRATSLGSVVQQMSLGLGVTIGAIVLQSSHVLQGHPTIVWPDFWPAFATAGLCSFASIKTGDEPPRWRAVASWLQPPRYTSRSRLARALGRFDRRHVDSRASHTHPCACSADNRRQH